MFLSMIACLDSFQGQEQWPASADDTDYGHMHLIILHELTFVDVHMNDI